MLDTVGFEQFIAESERSIHDALMVVKHSLKSGSVVAGGGAVELEVARHLRDHALSIEGKGQLIIAAFARALEVVPRQLCDNAGFDPNDILSALRRKHAKDADGTWYGVDIEEGGILDAFAAGIWEPSDNKANSLASAAEAAGVILSIDETVINPRSQDPGAATGMMGGGAGGGRPALSNTMGKCMISAGHWVLSSLSPFLHLAVSQRGPWMQSTPKKEEVGLVI